MSRLTRFELAFLMFLMIAIPAGIYHLVNGRFANGIMAFGALAVGLGIVAYDRRRRIAGKQ
jgi:hypothetical protein